MMYRSFLQRLCILASLSFFVASCNVNIEHLAQECQSGVVLVQAVSYYSILMDDGSTLFFKGSDFDKTSGKFFRICTSLDSMSFDTAYGTGFFISNDGRIATCRHLVDGDIKQSEAGKGVADVLKSLLNHLKQVKSLYEAYVSSLSAAIIFNPDTIPGLLQAQYEVRDLYLSRLHDVQSSLELLQLNDPSLMHLNYHSDVRVVYCNTLIQSFDELHPCTVRTISDTDDLAIIQLNTKQTPIGRHVFDISPFDMLQHYSFGEYLMHLIKQDKNSSLLMVGYNDGFNMAVTHEGIRPQHLSGSISKYFANQRSVQYTIPALIGSSGSPVLNRRGQVVAINFATADSSSNYFNNGVKEKYLYKLNSNL